MKSMRPGFSLVEVLVSLVMVSITITSLLSLQGTLQKMLYKDSKQWKAAQQAFLMFAQVDKKEPLEPGGTLQQEEQDFKIVYTVSQPSEGTVLHETKNIYVEKVHVSWEGLWSTQDFSLVRLAYRAPKPEKETTQASAPAQEPGIKGPQESKKTEASPGASL